MNFEKFLNLGNMLNEPQEKNITLGGGGTSKEGASTKSANEAIADKDFYVKEVDKRVVKVKPYATPIDTISRMAARKVSVASWEHKIYSIGSRPITTTLKTQVAGTGSTSALSTKLETNDAAMFSEADTILVVGVKGKKDGTASDDTRDLMLLVVGKDSDGFPTVVAINGLADDHGGYSKLPAIGTGTTLVRMGKACAETDAQAAKYTSVPSARIQYMQNFMFQVQQGAIEKLLNKETDWDFSDLEMDAIFDMRRGMELSFLFGIKSKTRHPQKDEDVYTTEGIWWQCPKKIDLGHYDAQKSEAVVDSPDMVDFCRDAFTGLGSGSKKKILVAGTDVISALNKLNNDSIRYQKSETIWGMEFESFKSFNGTILAIHSELFDARGMSGQGILIDPSELVKLNLVSFDRAVLDLKKAGVSNSDAVVMREVCALSIGNVYTCAQVKLATA